MSGPQFEIPEIPSAPSARSRAGWALLWLIIALLVGIQLIGYIFREPQSVSTHIDTSREYRGIVRLKEISKRYPQFEALATPLKGKFDDLIADVVDDRGKNQNAARLYVSMRYESGEKILPNDLRYLKASPDPKDKVFAQIYGSDKLDQKTAENLAERLKSPGFTFKMAIIHAMEKAGDKGIRTRLIPDAEIFKPLVATGLILLAFGVGTILLIVYFAMRVAGHFRPVGHPAGSLSDAAADHYAGRAALMMLIWVSVSLVLSFALRRIMDPEAVGLLSEICVIGATLYLATRLRDGGGRPIKLFGTRNRLLGDILWGFLAVFANVPLVVCCALFSTPLFKYLPPAEHPITFELAGNTGILSVVLIALGAAVMAPLFEETVFRGTITPAMAKLFGGPMMGIVASSLVFAAVHPTGVPAWPALAMIGAVAATLVYQRGSLVTSMVFHGVHNLSLVVLMLLFY